MMKTYQKMKTISRQIGSNAIQEGEWLISLCNNWKNNAANWKTHKQVGQTAKTELEQANKSIDEHATRTEMAKLETTKASVTEGTPAETPEKRPK